MDIDLLSKMVKELILDNDKVVLPGLGSFVAEIVPATFSDKGFTINPPYRKLYFRAKPDEGSALAEFYASSNKVNIDIAEKVIGDFVTELKSVLFTRKTVVFPGLGRLRATKENAVFFVADEDLDIYPEGFALEPISLKTHVETPAEVAAVVGSLKAMVDIPAAQEEEKSADVAALEVIDEVPAEEFPVEEVPIEDSEEAIMPAESEAGDAVEESLEEPVEESADEIAEESTAEEGVVEESIEEGAEEETEVVVEPVEEEPVVEESEEEPVAEEPVVEAKKKLGFWKIFAKTLMWLVIFAVVLLAAFILVARFAPDTLDKILYTPEELEIINR
jgi:nucleoid DNA-binding protein